MEDFEGEMLDFDSKVKELINLEVANEGHYLNLNHVLPDWEWRRRMCAIQGVHYIVHAIYLLEEMSTLVNGHISYGTAERESMRRTTSTRGQKSQASMMEFIEEKFEKMMVAMKELIEVMRDGNAIAEKHAQIAEKLAQIAEKHAQIAEKDLSILEKSRPRHYSEEEVRAAIEEIGITEEHKLKCYFFLCNEERNKRIFFGVPPHMRLQTLFKLMVDAGVQ